ncbi:MAG: hypothetical protein AAF962_06220 [Actinomycetota bacterium]
MAAILAAMGRPSSFLRAALVALALVLVGCGSGDSDESAAGPADPAGPTTSVAGGDGEGGADGEGADGEPGDDAEGSEADQSAADGEVTPSTDGDAIDGDEGDSVACPTPVWEDLADSSGLIGLRDDEPVTFVDGEYQERFTEGGTSYTETAWFLPEFFETPDLDGDCRGDVIAIFVWNGGGSGVFYELAVFRNTVDGLRLASRTLLNDRTEIRVFEFVGGELRLEYLIDGPGDAACCPSVAESTTLSAAQLLDGAGGDQAGAEAAAPSGGDGLTHEQIRDAFALDEPFLGYIGDCEQPFAEWNLVEGATPFCGRIVSVGEGEASIEIVDIDVGEPIPIRLVITDEGWRVDWDALG